MIKKLRARCFRVDFRDESGQRFRFNYPTLAAAKDAMAEIGAKVRKGEFVSPRAIPKFEEMAQEWLAGKSDRRPGTVGNWHAHIHRHLIPRLGSLRMDRIGVAGIEKLQDELRASGLSPSSVGAVRTTLRAIFDLAIRRGLLSGRNPVDDASRPFTAAREIEIGEPHGLDGDTGVAVREDEVLNSGEIRRLLAACEPGLYQALFTTAVLTGARSGELFGLRWGDVEFDVDDARGKILIRRSLTWARDRNDQDAVRPKFYPTKTKAGLRDVPIPVELCTVLRAWKLQCPPSEYDLVFATADGKPIRRSTALRCGLWPALRRASLRQVNMHSLRHSYASLLILGGAAVTEVCARLGHSSPKVTLDVYSHWFKGVETDSVDRLARSIMAPDAQRQRRDAEVLGNNVVRLSIGHCLDTGSPSDAVEAV